MSEVRHLHGNIKADLPENQASELGLSRYQDDRFGMFVHWGLYSLIGAGEWSMFEQRWSTEDYGRLAERFTAERFDAPDWARVAADAGQRYLTITSRHHDGWSLYDTALSTYKVTNSPFGRDPIAELAEALPQEGVRLGFYVSLLDWHHPAYRAALREKSGMAWEDYVEFLHGQVRELCRNYGDIATFWLDGYWPTDLGGGKYPLNWFENGGDFQFDELYRTIHRLQPDAVVMNNHHLAPLPGEDVQGFEGDVPGENTNAEGMNLTAPVLEVQESCQTVSRTYGFDSDDHDFRSGAELLSMLLRSSAKGANFLLNVGPTPEGELPLPARDRLSDLGRWLRANGEGVYGTRAGEVSVDIADRRLSIPPGSVVVTSGADNTHYLHLLDGQVPTSFCIDLPPGVHASDAHATLLHDRMPVPVQVRGDGDSLNLTVPAERRTGSATTVRIEVTTGEWGRHAQSFPTRDRSVI